MGRLCYRSRGPATGVRLRPALRDVTWDQTTRSSSVPPIACCWSTGAAALHPSHQLGAGCLCTSVREAARPPRTEFSAGKSGLHSVSSSLFSALLPFLLLLFPGSGHGRCDALRIQKVQQLCLGNFNAILFELCVQISQLDGLVEENPVVQSCV